MALFAIPFILKFNLRIVQNYFTLLFAGVRGTIIIANNRATSNTVIMTFVLFINY
jgi:hypothetical protein